MRPNWQITYVTYEDGALHVIADPIMEPECEILRFASEIAAEAWEKS